MPLWWAGALLALGGIGGAWLIRDSPARKGASAAHRPSFAAIVETALTTLRATRILRWFMYFIFAYWFSVSAISVYWQIYFEPFLGTKTFAGYFNAVFGAATICGVAITYFLTRRGRAGLGILLTSTLIGGAGYLAAALGVGGIALPFLGLLVFYASMGAFQTMRERYLNAYAPNEARSTILSCASAFAGSGFALGHVLASRSIDHFSFFWTWLAAAIFFLAVLPLIIARIKRYEAEYLAQRK